MQASEFSKCFTTSQLVVALPICSAAFTASHLFPQYLLVTPRSRLIARSLSLRLGLVSRASGPFAHPRSAPSSLAVACSALRFTLLLALHHGILSHCSVFKVQLPTSVKVRSQYPIAWILRSKLTLGLVGQSGLEPPTSRLSVVCSSQLSYWPRYSRFACSRRLSAWWRLPDSNR